jgi:hypothetical protein
MFVGIRTSIALPFSLALEVVDLALESLFSGVAISLFALTLVTTACSAVGWWSLDHVHTVRVRVCVDEFWGLGMSACGGWWFCSVVGVEIGGWRWHACGCDVFILLLIMVVSVSLSLRDTPASSVSRRRVMVAAMCCAGRVDEVPHKWYTI